MSRDYEGERFDRVDSRCDESPVAGDLSAGDASGIEAVPFDRPACSAEAARMITARSDGERSRHTKRERIALCVFACLLLVGGIALFSYINAGHGLNVAATSIDDMTGDMTGYGVILFEGTVAPDDDSDADDEEGVSGILSGIFGGQEQEGQAPEGSASSSSSSFGGSSSSGASSSGSASSDEGSSASSGASSSQGLARKSATKVDPVTLDEAEQVYRDKGASVITIDSGDLDSYSSGRIIIQGGRSYGIFSLTSEDLSDLPHRGATTTRTTTTTTEDAAGSLTTNTTTRVRSAYGSVSEIFESVDPEDISPDLVERIESMLEHFKECGVDTVIALTTDPTPFCAIEGVDVVVTFKQSDRFSMSEMIDGTMYFDAPETGQVGVLMVAPGNVVSSKVMKGE